MRGEYVYNRVFPSDKQRYQTDDHSEGRSSINWEDASDFGGARRAGYAFERAWTGLVWTFSPASWVTQHFKCRRLIWQLCTQWRRSGVSWGQSTWIYKAFLRSGICPYRRLQWAWMSGSGRLKGGCSGGRRRISGTSKGSWGGGSCTAGPAFSWRYSPMGPCTGQDRTTADLVRGFSLFNFFFFFFFTMRKCKYWRLCYVICLPQYTEIGLQYNDLLHTDIEKEV